MAYGSTTHIGGYLSVGQGRVAVGGRCFGQANIREGEIFFYFNGYRIAVTTQFGIIRSYRIKTTVKVCKYRRRSSDRIQYGTRSIGSVKEPEKIIAVIEHIITIIGKSSIDNPIVIHHGHRRITNVVWNLVQCHHGKPAAVAYNPGLGTETSGRCIGNLYGIDIAGRKAFCRLIGRATYRRPLSGIHIIAGYPFEYMAGNASPGIRSQLSVRQGRITIGGRLFGNADVRKHKIFLHFNRNRVTVTTQCRIISPYRVKAAVKLSEAGRNGCNLGIQRSGITAIE